MINYGFLGIIGYVMFMSGLIMKEQGLFLFGLLLVLGSLGSIFFVLENAPKKENEDDDHGDY